MPRVNHNINYGPWVIIRCQCTLINCNKCSTLLGVIDNEGSYASVEVAGIWEYLPLKFTVNL